MPQSIRETTYSVRFYLKKNNQSYDITRKYILLNIQLETEVFNPHVVSSLTPIKQSCNYTQQKEERNQS